MTQARDVSSASVPWRLLQMHRGSDRQLLAAALAGPYHRYSEPIYLGAGPSSVFPWHAPLYVLTHAEVYWVLSGTEVACQRRGQGAEVARFRGELGFPLKLHLYMQRAIQCMSRKESRVGLGTPSPSPPSHFSLPSSQFSGCHTSHLHTVALRLVEPVVALRNRYDQDNFRYSCFFSLSWHPVLPSPITHSHSCPTLQAFRK